MPGVLLCESVFQTGAIFLADYLSDESLTDENITPVLSRIRDARFKRMVKPGDTPEISVTLGEKMGTVFQYVRGNPKGGKSCPHYFICTGNGKEDSPK